MSWTTLGLVCVLFYLGAVECYNDETVKSQIHSILDTSGYWTTGTQTHVDRIRAFLDKTYSQSWVIGFNHRPDYWQNGIWVTEDYSKVSEFNNLSCLSLLFFYFFDVFE